MVKKLLLISAIAICSIPLFAEQYAVTGCGKTADLPLGWSDMSGTEKLEWLTQLQSLMCGKAWGGGKSRRWPSTEPIYGS